MFFRFFYSEKEMHKFFYTFFTIIAVVISLITLNTYINYCNDLYNYLYVEECIQNGYSCYLDGNYVDAQNLDLNEYTYKIDEKGKKILLTK